MSCTGERTSEETLTILHDEKCKQMPSDELIDYLIDSVPYLKTNDVSGWKKRFAPEISVPVPAKRRRQSPCAAIFTPLDPCVECKANTVFDDTRNGQFVCLTCGLIQSQVAFTADSAHCSYQRMRDMDCVYIHRYSRVVHFRAVISQITGQSNPEIDTETVTRIKEIIGDRVVDCKAVALALNELGLSRKYRRHATSISIMLGGREKDEDEIPADVYYPMIKMFLRVESSFNRKRKRVCPNRKVFFSYKFLLYQFLCQLGASRWAKKEYLLKGPSLLENQRRMYRDICDETECKVFM